MSKPTRESLARPVWRVRRMNAGYGWTAPVRAEASDMVVHVTFWVDGLADDMEFPFVLHPEDAEALAQQLWRAAAETGMVQN